MKTLVIKQHKSILNKRNVINCLNKVVEPGTFSVKEKGKRTYTVFFYEPVSASVANKVSKQLGLIISYQSDVRCILTDDFLV